MGSLVALSYVVKGVDLRCRNTKLAGSGGGRAQLTNSRTLRVPLQSPTPTILSTS